MSMIYDNWERLVAAVLKREEIWQLCHEHSRSPSICSESSDFSSSFRSSDVKFQEIEESIQKPVPKLVFLRASTPGFSLKDILNLKDFQELGEGTFGITILTHLSQDTEISDQEFLASGTKVVMKLLNEVKLTEEEFQQQMKVLGNCRHENVSAPRAYYFSNKTNGKLIVYDFHSQGNVSDMLHGKKGHADWKIHLMIAIRRVLYTRNKIHDNWESRLKIAVGAARGIAHIHTQFGAHGNIKSSNIFLNAHNYGCVSEFGLPSIMIKPQYRQALGYHAPEYNLKPVSQEADIYSFGILLLELLTGKSPMQAQGFEKDMHLVSWARSIRSQEWNSKLFDQSLRRPIRLGEDGLEMMLTENPRFHSLVKDSVMDWEALRANLGSHFHSMANVPANYFPAQDLLEMSKMMQVAMRCSAELPNDRPKMSEVVLMLENIEKAETGPKPPLSWL